MASRRFLVTDDILNEIDLDSVTDDDDFVESSELSPLGSITPAMQSNGSSDRPVVNPLGFPQSSSSPIEHRANRRSNVLARSSTPRPLFPVSPINSAAENTSLVSNFVDFHYNFIIKTCSLLFLKL